MSGPRILLGITGSIAAYKAALICRQLREAGAEVRVAMTASAQNFITATTMSALSAERVHTDTQSVDAGQIDHVELAYWADAMLVAPATANALAKLAHGIADDPVSLCALSVAGPLLLAPAMETRMWTHAATQANVTLLKARGAHCLGPAAGELASGRSGAGRMLDVDAIVEKTMALASGGAQDAGGALVGRSVLITAGPTAEDIDPVRFITNRSSGKMGAALAQVAAERGADVTLVHGPMQNVPQHARIKPVAVRSAQQMHDAVMARLAQTAPVHACIMAAAVADYTPAQTHAQKLKKAPGDHTLTLARTVDILATVGASDYDGVLIGFAAETENIIDNARAKVQRKGADFICANDVSGGAAFGRDDNHIVLVYEDGKSADLGAHNKRALARKIWDAAASLLRG